VNQHSFLPWRPILRRAAKSKDLVLKGVDVEGTVFITNSQFRIIPPTSEVAIKLWKIGFTFPGHPAFVQILIHISLNESHDEVVFAPYLNGLPGARAPRDLLKHLEGFHLLHAASPHSLRWPTFLEEMAKVPGRYSEPATNFHPVPA
jgi:hypothetical protein